MPNFVSGLPKHKLLILYTLSVIDRDATIDHVYRVLFELELLSYFDFRNAIVDLEEDGFVTAVPRPFGQSYRITADGRQSLALFGQALPQSERQRIGDCVAALADTIVKETQLLSSMEELPGGGFEVSLRAAEGARTLFSLTLPVPTRELALLVRKNWAENSFDIYDTIWKILEKPERT
ncbi:MAG: DUF4364 family protein [Clostridiales bacterium]|nr:DUF4364 family protein [Clostridiales bacterium]